MKISFVLPGFSRVPVGGYKMVFEYANRLVRHGFQVQIIFINNNSMNKIKAPFLIKKCLMSLATHYEPDWFSLDKRINKYLIIVSILVKKSKLMLRLLPPLKRYYQHKKYL